jgi:methylase of polypeptide subunit release factors
MEAFLSFLMVTRQSPSPAAGHRLPRQSNALIVRNPASCRWQMSLRISVFLWLMRRHRRPYDISYRGKTITIFPGVFSPKYDWSSKFAVDCLPALAGKSFLEVGAGCGIVSVFAAEGGARLVVAMDISPDSAKNIAFNFGARRLSNAHVIQGDLLAAISHKFDFIFFNAPYYGERPKDWLERAVTDENYDTLKRFLADVKRCLAAGGVVMLGFYKAREPLLRAEAQRAGLRVVSVREERRLAYRCKYFMLSAA